MKPEQPQSDSDSNDDQESTPANDGGTSRNPSWLVVRVAISVLIVAHLMAVVLPPLSFQTSGPFGASPSVGTLLRIVEPYSQFAYLDRGYAFFAPDPGPSHLIQAAVTESSGERTEVMFPDHQHQWPRLNYHRHFMLAEYLTEIYQPPGPPQALIDADSDEAELWARARARYERVRQSITDHLKYAHGGKHTVIRRIEHLIPNFVDYLNEPVALNDQRLYIVLLDRPIDGPTGPPEAIPLPANAETQSSDQNEQLEAPKQAPPASIAKPDTDDDAKDADAVRDADPKSAIDATDRADARDADQPAGEHDSPSESAPQANSSEQDVESSSDPEAEQSR